LFFRFTQIYIKIIIKIIKDLLEQKKFEHYEKILKNQLDLEKINLTKAMHEEEELNSVLNNTNYINNYIISNINDLYNEDKINFNYILFKYIIKNSIYEYVNNLLKKAKNAIGNIIKNGIKEQNNKSFFDLNRDLRKKLEYIILFIMDSKYYLYEFFKRNEPQISLFILNKEFLLFIKFLTFMQLLSINSYCSVKEYILIYLELEECISAQIKFSLSHFNKEHILFFIFIFMFIILSFSSDNFVILFSLSKKSLSFHI
jgi:hypothetical protein